MQRKGPALQLEMAHSPQAILDAMEQMRQELDRSQRQRTWGAVLVGGGIVFLVLLLCVGPQIAARSDSAFPVGALLVLLGVAAVAAIVAGIWLLVTRPRYLRARFEAAHQLLHTLRDDATQVVGRLDLSRPQQDSKRVRSARSGGGKRKDYYRDPWLRARLKIVDGNLLRLSLEDRVKTKAGSVVGYRTGFAAKLLINPEAYQVDSASPGGDVLAEEMESTSGGGRRTPVPPVEPLLSTLKDLYSRLQPLATSPELGSQPAE